MDETAVEATHDLLLNMAGRVDDDLLAWARELAAVGETQRAVELVSATLAADRTELPAPTRDALVEAARSVRIELDADRALAAPVSADGGTRHRFDAAPAAAVLAALRALPARLLVDCRVLLANRLTPAGSAPGPLPHPVVLVEVSPERNRDVLAYQIADALDRAGVRASVEVIAADQRLPAYHVEALRCARPVPPVGPDGGRARVPDEPSARPDRPTAPAPVPLRVAAARTAVTVEHNPAAPAWDEPAGDAVWADPGVPNGAVPEAARSDTDDRAGSVDPALEPGGPGFAAAGFAPTGSAPTGSAPTGDAPTGSAHAGSSPTGSAPPLSAHTGSAPTGSAPTGSAPTGSPPTGSPPTGSPQAVSAPTGSGADESASPPPAAFAPPALDPTAATPVVLDKDASEPERPEAVAAPTDPTTSGATTFGPAPAEPGAPGSATSSAEPDPTVPAPRPTGPEPAEPPARNHPGPDVPRSQPTPPEHRPGPRPVPADRTPRPAVPRDTPPQHGPGRAGPSDSAEPTWPRPVEPRPGDEQPTLTALPQRRRPEPNGADPATRIDAPGPLAGERRHRYLIEPSEPAPAADDTAAAGPHGTGRNPLVRAENGNTEPLIIRTPAQRQAAEPHPADRADSSGGPGIFAADAGDRTVPAGQLPGGPGPADLGLRPESVARLSASGRELLARLQAELQGSGTATGPRPGGLGPNRGGNGTGPQAKVDPPDLAG